MSVYLNEVVRTDLQVCFLRCFMLFHSEITMFGCIESETDNSEVSLFFYFKCPAIFQPHFHTKSSSIYSARQNDRHTH